MTGDPEKIFPEYLGHLDNALENFCDRYWPCEYVHPKTGDRCINVRSGHNAKPHQSEAGKVLSTGSYQSTFSFEDYQEHWQSDVYFKLVSLREKVRARQRSNETTSEEAAAAAIHKEVVLPYFLEHASNGHPHALISHTVCFCCLFEPPEHALFCGHVICTECLKTYGISDPRKRYIELAVCPMETNEKRFAKPWRAYIKPESCGLRVLTLDG